VAAVVLSVASPPETLPEVEWPQWDMDTAAGAAFLIALMGWMPTAVDLSTWNSIWTLERIEASGYRPSLRETLREFNLGYGVSAILAFGFLTLGALLLHRTGESLPSGSAGFAAGIVGLYAKSIGPWSAPIMGAAAFSAMMGTCVAVMDGYSRSLSQSLAVALDRKASVRWGQVALLTVAAGGLAIVVLFSGQIKQLVDLATTLSFLAAPLVAFWNLRLVTRPDFPEDARPGRALQAWAWTGLAFLTAFTLWFLWIQFAA
jgi:Mn2+/Fe2+ NRAMP family transporter